MARAIPGQVILVVLLLVAATSSVAAAPPAPSTSGTPHADGAPVSSFDVPLNETTDTTDTTDDDTNTTDSTVDSTTDTTTETSDDTNTTDDTTDTIDGSNTTDTVDSTADTTTDTTNTTDDATDTEDTTTEVTDSTDSTGETTSAVTDTAEETADTTGDTVENTTDTTVSLDDGDTVSNAVTESTDTNVTAAVAAVNDTISGATTELDGATNTLAGATETLESSADALVTETSGTETDLGDGLDSVLRYESEASTGREADYATGSDRTEASTTDQTDGDGTPDQSADSDASSEDSVVAADEGDSGGVLAGTLARLGQFGEWLSDDVPAGAAGIGAFALAAAACRQWLTQTASSGASTLLTSGLGGRVDGLLEKFWRLLLPAGYSRHDGSDPLDHDARQVLCEAIDSTPGIYLADLAERTDIPVSTVRYHVRVLAEEGVITTAKRRGKRRYYPAAADDVALADALSEPAKATVLRALAEHGEAHVGLLADELDRDPSTVTHHLQALDDDGLVEREQRGRTVVNQLADDVEAVLADAENSRGDVPVSEANAVADDPSDVPADD